MLKKGFIACLSFLLLTQVGVVVLAVEEHGSEGEHGATEGHGGSLWGSIGRFLNFIVFAAILYMALKKPLLNFLDRHAENIQKALREAKEEEQEAVQKAEVYQAKLLAIEEEALKIKQEAEQEALQEKKKLLAEAQAGAERLMSQAKFEVDQEVKKAKEELKTYAALLAVEVAEKKIRSDLTETDQKKLIENYMTNMENLN